MPDFPMDPEELARAIGISLSDWPGNCHGVAEAVLRRVPVEGMRLVRGHYEGPVSRDSIYGRGPQQHSWLELADGRILDPTRWAFASPSRPEIHLGENDGYDEAGHMLNARVRPAAMASAFLSGRDVSGPVSAVRDRLAALSPGVVADLFEAGDLTSPDEEATFRHAERLLDRLLDPVEHHRSPEDFFGLARECGLGAMVPVDTMVRVLEPERVTPAAGTNMFYDVPPAPKLSDQQKLFRIFCRFMSLEHRDLKIEEELEEIGYTLEDLHDALNDMDRMLRIDPVDPPLGRTTSSTLAVIAGDILGRGFGGEMEVERYARSIGLDRDALHDTLEAFGDRSGYTLQWLMPGERGEPLAAEPEGMDGP